MSLDLTSAPTVRAPIPRPGGFGHRPPRSKYLALLRQGCALTGADFASTVGGSTVRAAVYARRWAWARCMESGASYSGTAQTADFHHSTLIVGLRKMADVEMYIEVCRLKAVTAIGRFVRGLEYQ